MTRVVFFLTLAFFCLGSEAKTEMVLGDSLSASYGFDEHLGWVALLRQTLTKQSQHQVINASISGETSAGALARLPKLLNTHHPNIVIVELGGNDGLRGYPLGMLKNNLHQIVELVRAENARVLLVGMRMPPNYGARYSEKFSAIYTELAQSLSVPLVPFLLAKIATKPQWMQTDGIHPKAEAQQQILKNLMPFLQPLLHHKP